MAIKINERDLVGSVKELIKLAKDRGFPNCMITGPIMKSNDLLDESPDLIELKIVFMKPKKNRKRLFRSSF